MPEERIIPFDWLNVRVKTPTKRLSSTA